MSKTVIESEAIRRRRRKQRWALMAIATTAVILGVWFSPLRAWFTDVDFLRERVRSLGAFGPVAVILYHILQVVIAPIPGQALDMVNGYVFGWWGLLISMIGIGLGSILAIWLGRRFGRDLVRHLIGQPSMQLLEIFLSKSLPVLWLLLLLPGTPDDIICYALGLSTVSFRRAVATVMLGRAPGVALAVGLGATGSRIPPVVFIILMGAVSLIAWWLNRRWGRIR